MQSDKRRTVRLLTLMACLVYFSSYVTRINFAAIVVDFIQSEQVPKPDASIITTAMFVTYGVGQLISGYLGDRLRPQLLILFGLSIATLCNLILPAVAPGVGAMAVVWGINGLAQACMWPPLVKILKRMLTEDEYVRNVPYVSVASSLASVCVYLLAPLVIQFSSWRHVFSWCAAAGALCALMWLAFCRLVLRGIDFSAPPAPEPSAPAGHPAVGAALSLLPVILVTISLQGMLRDGISTWTPTFLTETFQLKTTVAILTSIALPLFHTVVNLFTARVHRRMGNRTFSCLALYFGLVTCMMGGLALSQKSSAALSLLFIAAGNGLTHGINLMQTCYLPSWFDRSRVSFYADMLNSATYVGSALSTWLFAALSERFGWPVTILSWGAAALCGLLLTLLCRALLEKRGAGEAKTPQVWKK